MLTLSTSFRFAWRKIRLGANFSFTPRHFCIGQYFDQSDTDFILSTLKKMDKSNILKSRVFNNNDNVPQRALPAKQNLTIAVEGNIGSGKSTLLKHFDSSSTIETICEPLEKWTNVRGHNALGLLYEDPKRWSFSFNMYAMLTRVNMHTKVSAKPVKMLERSLHSTKYCFIENSYQSGMIQSFENSILNQWYSYLTADHKADLDLIIYVRADPDVCYERVKSRSRKEEDSVPKVFLESLHSLHDDWLIHKKYPLPAPVLVLDANSDMSSMKEKYDQAHQEIICKYS